MGFALSIFQRELDHVKSSRTAVQHHLDLFNENQSVDEYEGLLQKANAILPTLSNDPRVIGRADSVLWHTDLHLGNIFVSRDEPTTIEGIID